MPQQEVTKSGQNLFFTYPDPLDAANSQHKQVVAFPFGFCCVLISRPSMPGLAVAMAASKWQAQSKGPHVGNLLYRERNETQFDIKIVPASRRLWNSILASTSRSLECLEHREPDGLVHPHFCYCG